jgi:hypothetical protein
VGLGRYRSSRVSSFPSPIARVEGPAIAERGGVYLKASPAKANGRPEATDSQTEILKGLDASSLVKNAAASLAVIEDSDFYVVKYGVVHRCMVPRATVLTLIFGPSKVNRM